MAIRSKIITVIALTIILTVSATTAFVLRIQSQRMVDDVLNDTRLLANIIESTIRHDMKEGDTKEVQMHLEVLGKNKEFKALRILGTDGTILKSMNRAEIGSKEAELIKSNFNPENFRPTFLDKNTVNLFVGIPNKKECHSCHKSSDAINGIIQIKQDISKRTETMASIKRVFIFSSIAIVLLVSVVLSSLFSHFVINPLKSLLSTIREVESGNMKAEVSLNSNDELGVIGSSFNKMIVEVNNLYQKNLRKERELSKVKVELEHKNKLEELNEQLQFKVKELETANRAVSALSKEVKGKNADLEKAVERLKRINEVGRILTSIIELEELVKIIIRTAADLLGSQKIILHLKGSYEEPITLQHIRGIGIERLDHIPESFHASYADVIALGKPLLLPSTVSGYAAKGSKIGVPFNMKGQIIGAIMLEHQQGNIYTAEDLELLSTLSSSAVVALDNAWLYENSKNNYFSTIQSLVNALEANDRFTRGHSERVRLLSLELGRHIGLDFKELELLEHASILHDIGKIGIDSFILQKQGKLTPKEFSMMKSHPIIGDEILGPIKTLDGVRMTIIQHHERYDGKGYPYGLTGEELSLKSRILSVVDTFDAMMSDRPYRKALPLHKIIDELRVNSGTQFDPYIVEAFIGMLEARGELLLSTTGYSAYKNPV